jgi:polyisoprenoid-binding protein YceI
VFKITKAEKKKSGEVEIAGDLTIKGITKPVTLPAMVKKENGVYTATGKTKINRTHWDIKFNSGSFFDPKKLGDKLINDDIEIEVSLRTVKM